jgi:hypothetical protein
MDHLNSLTRLSLYKNRKSYKKREDLADEYQYLGYWSSALDLDMKPALRKS